MMGKLVLSLTTALVVVGFTGLVHANMLLLLAGSSGGTPVVGGSAPALIALPAFSVTPTTTQASNGAWTGSTVTTSNGTWSGCASCTFRYQWYLKTLLGTSQTSQSNAYTVANTDITAYFPQASSVGTDSVFAVVTAQNAFGTTTAVTPVTPITRSPRDDVEGGSIVICLDGAPCTSTKPVDNTLAVGDWVSFTGETVHFSNPTGSFVFGYSWATDNTGIPAQGWSTVSSGVATKPFQIPASLSGYLIRATQQYHTSAGNGNATSGNTFPAGPIATVGGTILPPVNTGVPQINEAPAVPSSTPTIPYVGFVINSLTNSTPGSWSPIPYNVTTQWMYCSTAPESGVPAPCGTTPTAGSGATLVGTTLTGQTSIQYPVGDSDVGRSFFTRVTAVNSGGSTVQDSVPTAPATRPATPSVVVSPAIQGLPVVGNVGGGLGGTTIVASPGTLAGPVTSFTSAWFVCPPSTPACTTPATGAQAITNGVFTYSILPSDLGNQVRLNITGINATPVPVQASSAPVTVTTYVQPTPLSAGNLGTYPAGRDPLAAFNCAPAPTTYANNWYVDNSLGTNGTGTSASPFNTLVHGLAAAHPGDRILLRGNPAWNAAANSPGNYSMFLSGNNVDSFGNTDWITIAADTSTAPPSHPQMAQFGRPFTAPLPTDRGWNFDGIWFKSSQSIGAVSNMRDLIFQNGRFGFYPDLTTAINDFTANCVTSSCAFVSFAAWLNSHENGGVFVRGNATCEAFVNNTFRFANSGVSVGQGAADILIEGNDMAYATGDFNDIVDGTGPFIYHNNTIHASIGGPPGSIAPHQDSFQIQINGIQSNYGWEIDSNKMIRFTDDDAALISFIDQPYCTAHGISPCTSVNEGGQISCLQWNGTFTTGFRFVNNMCLHTEQMGYFANSLATIANNTYIGDTTGSNSFGGNTAGNNNYVANNAVTAFDCGPGDVAFNNVLLAGAGSGCSGAVSDTSGVDPFTDAYPAAAQDTTFPLTLNLAPPSGSSLYRTGLAGHDVPIVTINGSASTAPPNIGAY